MTEVTLRRAGLEDARRLFEWRNDPVTRAMALNTTPLRWETHIDWLTQSLFRSDRALIIGEAHGIPFGILRFDFDDKHGLISITLAPEARGKGLAVPFLQACCTRYPTHHFTAQVRANNAPSLALFTRAGFTERNTENDIVTFEKDPEI